MVEQGLELLGPVGLIDPPRDEAAAAVHDCVTAGITPVMITGDHPATALAIARRLGIVPADDTAAVLTGAELAALDDAALREGRRIFDNIGDFVHYAMAGNSGKIWTIFLAPLFGLPIPPLPIHLLWVNLVTDGLLIGALCLGVQAGSLAHAPAAAQTMVFTMLTLAQMAHVLAIRSETDSLWRLGLHSNLPRLGAVALTFALQLATVYVPWLQPVFSTVPLGAAELALCRAAALVVLAVVEAEKAGRRLSRR